MFKKGLPFFIRILTPLHAGTGQELGVIDLPIQRERHTGLPKIESSGVKGGIREVFKEKLGKKGKDKIEVAFGPEDGNDYAATLGFTEARVLLFPIKSAKGIFALTTCPMVLQRFKRELSLPNVDIKEPPEVPKENTVPEESEIVLSSDSEKYTILEEFTFKVKSDPATKEWAEWLQKNAGVEDATKKLIVLPDNEFKTLISLATEVITRIRIDPMTGTVKTGQLFTEEFLPSETFLYSLALATPLTFNKVKETFGETSEEIANNILNFFTENIPGVIQLGGDATIGKGIVKIEIGGGK